MQETFRSSLLLRFYSLACYDTYSIYFYSHSQNSVDTVTSSKEGTPTLRLLFITLIIFSLFFFFFLLYDCL